MVSASQPRKRKSGEETERQSADPALLPPLLARHARDFRREIFLFPLDAFPDTEAHEAQDL